MYMCVYVYILWIKMECVRVTVYVREQMQGSCCVCESRHELAAAQGVCVLHAVCAREQAAAEGVCVFYAACACSYSPTTALISSSTTRASATCPDLSISFKQLVTLESSHRIYSVSSICCCSTTPVQKINILARNYPTKLNACPLVHFLNQWTTVSPRGG